MGGVGCRFATLTKDRDKDLRFPYSFFAWPCFSFFVPGCEIVYLSGAVISFVCVAKICFEDPFWEIS